MRTSTTLCLFLLLSGCAGGDDFADEPIVGDQGGKADGTGGIQYYRLRVGQIDLTSDWGDIVTDPDPQVCVGDACTIACENTLHCEPIEGGWLTGQAFTAAQLMSGIDMRVYDWDYVSHSDLIGEDHERLTKTGMLTYHAGAATFTLGAARLCTPPPPGATLSGRILRNGDRMYDLRVEVTSPDSDEVNYDFRPDDSRDFALPSAPYCARLHAKVTWDHIENKWTCDDNHSNCGYRDVSETDTIFNGDIDLREKTLLDVSI